MLAHVWSFYQTPSCMPWCKKNNHQSRGYWGFLSSIFYNSKHSLCSGNISLGGYVHSNYAVLVIHNNQDICKSPDTFYLDKLLICIPYVRESHASRVALQQTGKLLHPGEDRYVTHREIHGFAKPWMRQCALIQKEYIALHLWLLLLGICFCKRSWSFFLRTACHNFCICTFGKFYNIYYLLYNTKNHMKFLD